MQNKKQEQLQELQEACTEVVEYAEPIYALGNDVEEYVVPAEEFEAMQAVLNEISEDA